MSLVEYQPSERERQIAQWRAARKRMEAAAIVKAKPQIPVQKSVEKLVMVRAAPTVPQFVAPGERDWLDVSTKYTIADIIKEVCIQFEVTKFEILSHRRQMPVTSARQIAMTLCKYLTARSLPEIGRRIGDRDHTTVLHACRKYQPVLEVVIAKVPDHSPIQVWVAAFKTEIALTEYARRKPYVRRIAI